MDTSKLKVGMEIKNYKELCTLLEVEVLNGGTSKKSQIKDFERYFSYDKKGHKFIITKIHEKVLNVNDGRSVGKNAKYLNLKEHMDELCEYITDNYNYDIEKLTAKSKIKLNWKCDNCEILHDKEIFRVYNNKSTICNRCLQSKGAKSVLEVLERLELEIELEYSFEDLKGYKHPLRFDFAVFDNNDLKCLIEYDGGYHDTGEQDEYDNLKNEYCEKNNIPLLRVHHTEDDITYSVLSFIKNLKLKNVNYDVYNKEIEDNIKELENEIMKLKSILI